MATPERRAETPEQHLSALVLLRQVNTTLAARGLRWCRRCGDIEENRELIERIVEGAAVFELNPAIKLISSFGTRGKLPSGRPMHETQCKPCKARTGREYRAANIEVERERQRSNYATRKLLYGEEFMERERARWTRANRARMDRAKTDPELAAHLRSYARATWDRLKADPERHAEYSELRRLDERIQRLDDGLPVRMALPSPAGALVPAGPFRQWLEVVVVAHDEDDHLEEIAAIMETPLRSLRRIADGQRWVQVALADRCMTRWNRPVRIPGRMVDGEPFEVVDEFADLYDHRVPLHVVQGKAAEVFGDSFDGRVLPSVEQPDEEVCDGEASEAATA